MSFQEKFSLTSNNADFFSRQFDILIIGARDEADTRHMYFRANLPSFGGQIYSFDTCEKGQRFSYKIYSHDGQPLEEKNEMSLIPELETLIKNKEFAGANICIDITTLKQGILFLLINLLVNRIKPARLFAAYTEPTDYKKKKVSEFGDNEEYDLYDKLIGSSQNAVPGFSKPQTSRDILLIAPMGFDSQRLQTIYENLKPKSIIPIVGFPSFIPGWNITAIKMNYMVLKAAECFDMIKCAEASSPFELYALLKEEFERHQRQYDVYISPLGTRPHCLGVALFVSRNKNAYLIYDFPVEKKYRSENVLKTNIYNISKYIE